MNIRSPKVLIVATSRKTRGGITSVIKAHELGEQWKKFHCKWIETHRDGNAIRKILYLITSIIRYLLILPFYDIIHIHIATRSSAIRKQLFIFFANLLNKKVILHFHPSNEKFLFENKNKVLYKRLFNKADLILVLSNQWKVWLKESLEINDKIQVLYNPSPNVNRIESARENQILFAGTLIKRKGYDILIKAFSLIANKHKNWRLVFAGNGEIENAKEIALKNGVLDKVDFLGWVNGKEKETVFQKASIYCLASEGEGFPMGMLDAWAYGIPCVVTPVGGIPDIVKHGVNALIFNVGDVEKLKENLLDLIGNSNLRYTIVENSDILVKDVFEIKKINSQLNDIYERILN